MEDVEESYSFFCEGVLEGLRVFGIDAHSHKGTIMINGRKVSGSAQHRLYDTVLHHGTLMIDVNLRMLGHALRISNPERRVMNLRDLIPQETPLNKIKKIIIRGFEKALNVTFVEGLLTSAEKHVAEGLYQAKYSRKSWNSLRTRTDLQRKGFSPFV